MKFRFKRPKTLEKLVKRDKDEHSRCISLIEKAFFLIFYEKEMLAPYLEKWPYLVVLLPN